MIHPAPTSKIDPTLARGVFAGSIPATATKPAMVKLTFLNTNYELHLIPGAAVSTPEGKRILGVIRAKARRVDVVQTGGRYVEPVMGRPRRVQGTVIAVNEGRRSIVVDAGVPIECELTDERQRSSDFPVGVLVSFDVLEGATFSPNA
jgi:hypothetical protein